MGGTVTSDLSIRFMVGAYNTAIYRGTMNRMVCQIGRQNFINKRRPRDSTPKSLFDCQKWATLAYSVQPCKRALACIRLAYNSQSSAHNFQVPEVAQLGITLALGRTRIYPPSLRSTIHSLSIDGTAKSNISANAFYNHVMCLLILYECMS